MSVQKICVVGQTESPRYLWPSQRKTELCLRCLLAVWLLLGVFSEKGELHSHFCFAAQRWQVLNWLILTMISALGMSCGISAVTLTSQELPIEILPWRATLCVVFWQSLLKTICWGVDQPANMVTSMKNRINIAFPAENPVPAASFYASTSALSSCE